MASSRVPTPKTEDCKFNTVLFPVKDLIAEARSGRLGNLVYYDDDPNYVNKSKILNTFLFLAAKQSYLCRYTDWTPYQTSKPLANRSNPVYQSPTGKIVSSRNCTDDNDYVSSSVKLSDRNCKITNENDALGEVFEIRSFDRFYKEPPYNGPYVEGEAPFEIYMETSMSTLNISVKDRMDNGEPPVLVQFTEFTELSYGEEGNAGWDKDSKTIALFGTEKQKDDWKAENEKLEEFLHKGWLNNYTQQLVVVKNLGRQIKEDFQRREVAWNYLQKTFDSDGKGNYRFVSPLAVHKNYRYRTRRYGPDGRVDAWNDGHMLPEELNLRNASDSIRPGSLKSYDLRKMKQMADRNGQTLGEWLRLMNETDRSWYKRKLGITTKDLDQPYTEFMEERGKNDGRRSEVDDEGFELVDTLVTKNIGYSFFAKK